MYIYIYSAELVLVNMITLKIRHIRCDGKASYINERKPPSKILMEEIQLTTWDVQNLVNSGMNYFSTSAGCLPSTVCLLPMCPLLPSCFFCSSSAIVLARYFFQRNSLARDRCCGATMLILGGKNPGKTEFNITT